MDATHLSVDGAQVTKWVPSRTSHWLMTVLVFVRSPNMYFCVASTLYLVGAQFKVISEGDFLFIER